LKKLSAYSGSATSVYPKIDHTLRAKIFSSEPFKISCHVIVTQQRETVEQCARKFRNVSLQAKERTWVEFCKFITASHQNSEAGFCAVWAPYR